MWWNARADKTVRVSIYSLAISSQNPHIFIGSCQVAKSQANVTPSRSIWRQDDYIYQEVFDVRAV